MRWIGRLFVFTLLVGAAALPTRLVAAADDPGQAALAFLPPGFAVTFAQTVDLGGDGQIEAIVVAESHPTALRSQIAALLVRQNGAWQLAYRTPADQNAFTAIYAYPRTTTHPGFVVTNWHFCGANCNTGGHAVIRWDGSATTVVLDGSDDRGFTNADSATGTVFFRSPLWLTANARCCALYQMHRTWVWKGTDLVPDTFVLADSGNPQTPPLPDWVKTDGPTLFTALAPFQQTTAPAAALTPLFAPSVTIQNPEGACAASGSAVATALVGRAARVLYGLWNVSDGYDVGMSLRTSSGDSSETQADGCRVGGNGIGGYIFHLTATSGAVQIDAMQSVPDVYKAAPGTAIQVPPV